MKKIIIFAIAAILLWFPIAFGLGAIADIIKLPDTETWLWVIRIVAGIIVACIGWLIVGAKQAEKISIAAIAMTGIVSSCLFTICVILAVFAAVMIFVKGPDWLYDHLYGPYISNAVGLALLSFLPLTLLLMVFRATRALGGFALYLLTFFFGFSLWFYALLISGSHGIGWTIGGLLMCGVGVIFTAIISSAVWGQWSIAGGIILALVLIWIARLLGETVAEKQFEKDREIESAKAESISVATEN